MMSTLRSALVVLALTWLGCSLVYTTAVWGIAQSLWPEKADGSLVRDSRGTLVGSALVAQKFEHARYFWPRPSAADYNATAAAGSNLSPANPAITERAQAIIAAHARPGVAVPADLVTASGSGLDPHISLAGALYQAPRVALARNRTQVEIERIVQAAAEPVPGADGKLVNVLRLNLALDAALGRPDPLQP